MGRRLFRSVVGCNRWRFGLVTPRNVPVTIKLLDSGFRDVSGNPNFESNMLSLLVRRIPMTLNLSIGSTPYYANRHTLRPMVAIFSLPPVVALLTPPNITIVPSTAARVTSVSTSTSDPTNRTLLLVSDTCALVEGGGGAGWCCCAVLTTCQELSLRDAVCDFLCERAHRR